MSGFRTPDEELDVLGVDVTTSVSGIAYQLVEDLDDDQLIAFVLRLDSLAMDSGFTRKLKKAVEELDE